MCACVRVCVCGTVRPIIGYDWKRTSFGDLQHGVRNRVIGHRVHKLIKGVRTSITGGQEGLRAVLVSQDVRGRLREARAWWGGDRGSDSGQRDDACSLGSSTNKKWLQLRRWDKALLGGRAKGSGEAGRGAWQRA